jgi:putative transposase
MAARAGLTPGSGVIAAACDALNLARASFYRRQARHRNPLSPQRPRPKPARSLGVTEREDIGRRAADTKTGSTDDIRLG